MRTKYIAAIAVLAMVICAFAVINEDANDATFTPGSAYQPTAAAIGDAKMKVIVYDDGVILIDTNSMANLDKNAQFDVGLVPYSGETQKTEVKFGPIAFQNGRQWIDATGANGDSPAVDFLTNSTKIDVKLYSHDSDTGSTLLDTATATFSTSLATVHLYANWKDSVPIGTIAASEVNNGDKSTDYAGNSGNWLRLVKKNVTAEGDSHLVTTSPAGYTLKGFAKTYSGSSTIVLQPNKSMTVEDLIFELFDSTLYDSTTNNPIQSGKIELYAIWEKATYQMLVADVADVATTADSSKYGNVDVEIKISTTVAKANLTERVAYGDFGLLRIQQTVSDNYTYTLGNFQYISATDAAGVNTWADATEGTHYSVTLLANGLYKIVAKDDIRFTVAASKTDKSTMNGFDFSVDSITNGGNAAHPTGNVQLSLDLFDYKATAVQNIKLKGTYFRTLGASDSAVRVYGNIDVLSISDATAAASPVAANTWSAKINGVNLTSEQIAADDPLNGGVLTLNEDDSMYDLMLDLYDYNIYGAQGVWTNFNGSSTLYTPWALYQSSTPTS